MSLSSRSVLRIRVDAPDYEGACSRTLDWVERGESRYVCVAHVHMTMEAFDSPEFGKVVNGADIVTPDGRPLVWALRFLGLKNATQVRGADLMSHLVERAAREGVPVGFYGGKPAVLKRLVAGLESRFPALEIACSISPPFRTMTAEEDREVIEWIAASGARILFVGLGCPRQERWMAEHRGRIPTVMVGVGAAFDFHAGMVKEAPRSLQRIGLEWVFRLVMDPKRLWRRYAIHNPRFMVLFALQMLGLRNFYEAREGQEPTWRD